LRTALAVSLTAPIGKGIRETRKFCALGGGPMMLWWLTFRGGAAVIIEGESIAHARRLATVNELGRASHFVAGYPINPELVELIPDDATFRELRPVEAGELLKLLRGSPKCGANLVQQTQPLLMAG
jgi:hypothetical protein